MDEKECEFYTISGGCELSIGGVCKNVLNCYFKENKKLTEQLSIAMEALNKLADYNNMKLENIYPTVSQALAKIEKVK
jgi:hypothetical protein